MNQNFKKLILIILFFLGLGVEKIIIAQELPCYSTVLLQQGFSYRTWHEKLGRKQDLSKIYFDYQQINNDIFEILAKNRNYGKGKHIFGVYHASFDYITSFEGHDSLESGPWLPNVSYKDDYKVKNHWLISPQWTESEMRHKVESFNLSKNKKFNQFHSYVFFALALRIGIEHQLILNDNDSRQKILVFLLDEDDVYRDDFLQAKEFFINFIDAMNINVVMLVGNKNKTQEEVIELMNGIVEPRNLFFVDFNSKNTAELFRQKKSKLLERLNTIIQCNRA